ncbi:UNKNOWN [Stylonychia lemnae]|uniref:Uncharacterized protein n=1 Tax=Stylonychia lemnae TaxID=5949 RepID=A0A078ATP7_STYLE|nr:UNKNOWN [Stylonychia lemnae]|eukprot:CDW84597.1 UNKNOWN [Stylonychia lemnae]
MQKDMVLDTFNKSLLSNANALKLESTNLANNQVNQISFQIIKVEAQDFYDQSQAGSKNVTFYQTPNTNAQINLLLNRIIRQDQYNLIIAGQAYIASNSYGILYMSSLKTGCYSFHDLTSITTLNQNVKMLSNFIKRIENIEIDATCDKSSAYVAYNFSIKSQDIRFLQKVVSYNHSCNNVEGSPKIQFNMGDSAIHNDTLCFIGLPCAVNFGNFSIPQCSDANSFNIEIRDSAQDLDQLTGNFQHSFQNLTFTYSLKDNIKDDSRKIFIGDHYLTVIGSLQFPNKFKYTTSQVIVKLTVAYCYNHLQFTDLPILVDMKYKLGEGPITQSFRPHSFQPHGCRYQYVLQSKDDQRLEQKLGCKPRNGFQCLNYIQFIQGSPSFNIYDQLNFYRLNNDRGTSTNFELAKNKWNGQQYKNSSQIWISRGIYQIKSNVIRIFTLNRIFWNL